MNLLRNIDASQLIIVLQYYGYQPTRQTGSHIRLTTQLNGSHHITIPNHAPLRIGTLNAILNEVAQHIGITKQELMNRLL